LYSFLFAISTLPYVSLFALTYLTTFCSSSEYTYSKIAWWDVYLMVNYRVCGRKQTWFNFEYYRIICLQELSKTMKS
jgi:hypothetical protein